MSLENHPENNDDVELSLDEEEYDFNKFIKGSDFLLDQKFDEASTEVIISLMNELIKNEIQGDLESYAKMTALIVLKLKRFVRVMFDDNTADAFIKAVEECINQDKLEQ